MKIIRILKRFKNSDLLHIVKSVFNVFYVSLGTITYSSKRIVGCDECSLPRNKCAFSYLGNVALCVV